MSLRRRLLLGGLIVALALAAADGIVAAVVRSYLLGRVDRQLEPGVVSLTQRAVPMDLATLSEQASSLQRSQFLTDFYVDVRDAQGGILFHTEPAAGSHARPSPRLEAAEVLLKAGTSDTRPRPFTVRAVHGNGSWRVVSVRQVDNRTVVVTAQSLAETEATIRRVFVIELSATAGVLAILGLVALWVLRHGVRPLDDMAKTAEAIAEGSLSTRVEHTDTRTEAGRLAVAFNAMLHRIEDTFRQRSDSEERLRQFVADASHELRTPLTSIQGYTDLWHQGGLRQPAEVGEAMRRMGSEANRMSLLVDDLLLLARLDQGRQLDRMPVRLDLLAVDAVADARAVEPDRPIHLDVPSGGVTVHGDEGRLRQVTANLITNARIHTPAGTPVHVRVTQAGDQAALEVADAGPGLSPEDAPRVFERFYRVDSGRSRSRGGAGLGLAIVAAVAEAHGGRVELETAPGQGARFVVHLPLVHSPREEDPAPL